MDDGNSFQNGRHRAYRFSTNSFPLEDQSLLVEVLRDNFDIDATIQKDRSHYRLYIRSKSNQRFLDLIRLYIQTCFAYKM